MINQKQAIEAIKKAKAVFVTTRLTEHDMIYTKGNKTDLIYHVNKLGTAGTTEFNILVCSDGDVVIG